MDIRQNVPLSDHSTMRLGGNAAYLCDITDRFEIARAYAWAAERNLPVIMIGDGSNIVWRDEGYPGLVLVNKIKRFESFNVDEENLYLTAGAGENWDAIVQRSVEMGYGGLAELSLIPGTVGAAPVQNIGAYGREIMEVIATVEAYDVSKGSLITIPGSDCDFAYRSSRFKTTDKGKFNISAVTFHLKRSNPQPPFYDALSRYFGENNITTFTLQTIRDAVIAIRSAKLPDPQQVPNNGSFFTNPIVRQDQISQLVDFFPNIMYWNLDADNVKVSAAWLLEQAGFKNYYDNETGMATWEKQPLVFVNTAAKSTKDLLIFRDKIITKVQSMFGITLVQEPELLP